jgi:hypothetical protein
MGGVILLAAAGCGGAPSPRATPEVVTVAASQPVWRRSPVALLPQDAVILVHVDGRQLRASPWFEPVSAIVREAMPDEGRQLTALAGALDEAWIALREPERGTRAEQVVSVARGENLESAARAAVATWLGSAPASERDGVTAWEGTSGTDALRVLRFDANTWAVALGGEAGDLLARARAVEPSDPLGGAGLASLAAQTGWAAAPIGVVARVTPGLRRSVSAERVGLSSLVEAERLGLRIDPSRGLVADLTAEFGDASGAARASDEVTGVVSRYANNPMVAMMGFSDILQRIAVRAVAARVEVRVSLNEDEVRTLLERFGPIVGAALVTRDVDASASDAVRVAVAP